MVENKIEFVDLNESDVVKVVLVIEMTKSKDGNLKFDARKLKLNQVEQKYYDKFIEENIK